MRTEHHDMPPKKKTVRNRWIAVFLIPFILSSCVSANSGAGESREEQLPTRKTDITIYVKEPEEPIVSNPENNIVTYTCEVTSKYCEVPLTMCIPVALYRNGSFRQVDMVYKPTVQLPADSLWHMESLHILVVPSDGGDFPTTSLEYRFGGTLLNSVKTDTENERISFYEGGIIDLYP